jgi:ribosomal protein L9
MGSFCGLNISMARRKEIITPICISVRNGTSISVILLEKLMNRGGPGAVVKVKRGHARNHLVPQKLAAYATEENKLKYAILITSATNKEAIEKAAVAASTLQQSTALSTLIADGIEFRRATVEGSSSLFGSVTVEDLKAHINSIGLEGYTLHMAVEFGIKTTGVHKVFVNGNEINVTVTQDNGAL